MRLHTHQQHPNVALMGKLWGVSPEFFKEKLPWHIEIKNYRDISRSNRTDPTSGEMDCVWCPFHSNRTYPPYTEVITQSISKLTSWVIYVWFFISIVAAVYLNNLFNKPWTTYHSYVMSPVGHGFHDEVMVWEGFPHYWPFVRRIHQLLVDSHHKGLVIQ